MLNFHLHLLLWGAISMPDDCNNTTKLHPGETQDTPDKCAPTLQNCHQKVVSFSSIFLTAAFLISGRTSPRLSHEQKCQGCKSSQSTADTTRLSGFLSGKSTTVPQYDRQNHICSRKDQAGCYRIYRNSILNCAKLVFMPNLCNAHRTI